MFDEQNATLVYEVYCVKHAYKEWEKLNNSIKLQFIKKLQKLISNPRIENSRLHGGLSDCYKIKLKRAGYRLVYQVVDDKVILLIWAVDKRENDDVYEQAIDRLKCYQDSPELLKVELE